MDYAGTIKASVTMMDAVSYYGIDVDRRTRKALCPFHQDTHPSMHIYPRDKGYHCFVCGVGGDVIDFVMRLFGLSFMDACKKIDEDFRLGLDIGEEQSEDERKRAAREFAERMDRKREAAETRQRLEDLYGAAYNRFAYLDRMKQQNTPKDPSGPISPEYAYACRLIDGAWQDVEDAMDAIRKFEEETERAKRNDQQVRIPKRAS